MMPASMNPIIHCEDGKIGSDRRKFQLKIHPGDKMILSLRYGTHHGLCLILRQS
jgi:hypothetical protein